MSPQNAKPKIKFSGNIVNEMDRLLFNEARCDCFVGAAHLELSCDIALLPAAARENDHSREERSEFILSAVSPISRDSI